MLKRDLLNKDENEYKKGVYETEKYEKQCFALLNQKVPRTKKGT